MTRPYAMNPLFHLPGRSFAAALCAAGIAVSAAERSEEGIPFVERFTPRQYGAHSQSLDLAIDSRGVLHVANLVAVLQYDGARWRRMNVPGTSTVYGVAITGNGRIYVGGAGQLGYLEPDPTGGATFVSLNDSIPPGLRPPDEAYREVESTTGGVFFQCVNSVLRWRDGRFDALPIPKDEFPTIHSSRDELFVSRPARGLFALRGDELELVCDDERLKMQAIRSVVRMPDGSVLIGTLRSGVFRCENGKLEPLVSEDLQSELSDRLVSGVARLASGEIAVSTYRGGIVFLDAQGAALRWVNDQNGLSTPVVARMLQDAEGGLWCLQENGVARIEVHSPVTVFDARLGVSSSASEFARHDGTLYLGTLRGVLRLVPATGPASPARWEPVAGGAGQAFALESHPDGMLASVDRQIVRIRDGVAEPLVQMPSLTYALTRSTRDPDVVFASNRYGLAALRLRDGKWESEGFMPGMQHELRDVHEDPATGTIWFGTAAHGAGRITGAGRDGASWWDGAELTKFDEKDGLPEDGLAMLDRIGERNVFTTTSGMMEFDPATDRFVAVPRSEIGPGREGDWYWAALTRDSEGNSWGVVEPIDSDSGLLAPEVEYRTAGGAAFAVPPHVFDAAGNIMLLHLEEDAGRKIIWVAGTEAVLRWDAGRAPTGITPSRTTVLLRKASLGDTALPLDASSSPELAMNSGAQPGALRFEFASPSFDRDARPEFASRLEGFDRGWSAWSVEPAREFNYLPSGSYRFEVRARTAAGGEAKEALFGFMVPAPWYLTVPAFGGYAILGLFGVMGIVRWRGAALQRRNEQLEHTISERTAELMTARDDADRANRAKSVFLANMSHELRTPLNGILGYTQILRRDPTINPQNRQRLGVLESSGEHLLRLINEVLDLSKIEAGRLELQPVASDVRSLAQAVAETLRPRFEEKKLGFALELDPHLPHRVLIDEQKIGQVLFNLLGNALKFTKSGRVAMRLTTSENSHGQGQLRFEVADTGIGIAPEQQSRIFEPFSQVDDGTRRGEGTGLGLAICARIVELMSGRLRVESSPGKGSRFWFEIPAHEIEGARSSPGQADPARREVTGYEGPRKRVLVVDDVPVNRNVIRELLEPLGFEVVEAADGASAIETMRAHSPDIVLMDLRMAPMSGVEAVKRIRADESLRGLRIVAFSASTIGFTRAQALEIGCDDLLSKPFRESDLFAVLERQVRIRWRHAVSAASEGRGLVATPSPEQASAVLAAARRGDASAVRAELERLAANDASLTEWTGAMEKLVEQFRMQEIRRRLEALAHVS